MAFYPGTLETSNINAFGVVFAKQIAGHKVVKEESDLFTITDPILSASKTNENNDALGQEWYVTDEQCKYELIDWDNRNNIRGWKRIEIFNCLSYSEYQLLVSNEEISETTLYMIKNSRGNLINKLFYGYIPIKLESYVTPELTGFTIKDVPNWVETTDEIQIRELSCTWLGTFLDGTGKLYEIGQDGTRTLLEDNLTIARRISLNGTYTKNSFLQGRSYKWILTAIGDDDVEVESPEFEIKAYYDIPVINSFTLNGNTNLVTSGTGNYRINTMEFNISNSDNIEPNTIEILDNESSFWINPTNNLPTSPVTIGLYKSVTVGNAYNFYLKFYGKDKTGSRVQYRSNAVLLNSQIVASPLINSWSIKFYDSNSNEVTSVNGAQTITISDVSFDILNSENADLSTVKVWYGESVGNYTELWNVTEDNPSSTLNLETGKTYYFTLTVDGLSGDGSIATYRSSNYIVFNCNNYEVPTITWSDVANPSFTYAGGALKVAFTEDDYIITNPENVTSDPVLYYCDNSATGDYQAYNSVSGVSLTTGHTYYFKLYITGRDALGTTTTAQYKTTVAKTFTYNAAVFTSFDCSNTIEDVEGISTITLNNISWSFSDDAKIDPDTVQLLYSYTGPDSNFIIVDNVLEGSNVSFQTTKNCIGKTVYLALSASDWSGHTTIYSYSDNLVKSFNCRNYDQATVTINSIEFTDKLSETKISTSSNDAIVYGSGQVVINSITYTATNAKNILTNGDLYYKISGSSEETKIGSFVITDGETKSINVNLDVIAGNAYQFYIKTTKRNNVGDSVALTTNSIGLLASNAKPVITLKKLYNGNTELNNTTISGGSVVTITKITYSVFNPNNLTSNLTFTGNGVLSGTSFAYSSTGVYEFPTPITYTTSIVSSTLSYKLTSTGYMGTNDTIGTLNSNSVSISVVAESLPIYYGVVGPEITGASENDFEVDDEGEPLNDDWYTVYDVSRVTDAMFNTAIAGGNSTNSETMSNTDIPLVEMGYVYVLVPDATGRSAKIYNGIGGYITFDEYTSEQQPAEWNMNGQRIVVINNINYKLYAAFSTTSGGFLTIKVD